MQTRAQTSRPFSTRRPEARLPRALLALCQPQAVTGPTVRQNACQKFKAATLVGAASLALLTGFAFSPDIAHAEDGRTVFNNNCAVCHMGGRNSVAPERTLDKAALEQYLAGGFKLESIIYQVNNGKGAMPAWADRLDEEEVEAVARYVLETAEAGAWDDQ